MKRFTIFIALLLCLTITGVYATWMYAGVETDVADVQHIMQVALEDYDFDGASGTLYVTSNLALKIDQDPATKDHSAKMVYTSIDNQPLYMEIKFVPNANADKLIKDNGIDVEWYFTTSADMQVKIDSDGNLSDAGTATDIFEFSNETDGVFNANILNLASEKQGAKWTRDTDSNGDPYFTYTFNEDALKTMITLGATFKLDTKADYDLFNDTLLHGKILAKVSDGTVNNIVGG